jgi:hypothetical protein
MFTLGHLQCKWLNEILKLNNYILFYFTIEVEWYDIQSDLKIGNETSWSNSCKWYLAIKFIILIETSGAHTYYINKIIELIFKFKSKLSGNKKYINRWSQIWIAYFNVIEVKLIKNAYQLFRFYTQFGSTKSNLSHLFKFLIGDALRKNPIKIHYIIPFGSTCLELSI